MTETLTRRRDVLDRHTEWSVHGPEGAVSFAVFDTNDGQEFGAIALHYTVTEAHERSEFSSAGDCHLLDSGRCHADVTWLHGRTLGERWDAGGRRDETVYAELTDWYTSRLAR